VSVFGCPWLVLPAVIVGMISAWFFVLAVDGEDKPLAWATATLYVSSCLVAAWCSLRLAA
jgi:hypothetical protein